MKLTPADQAMLTGEAGGATRLAMQFLQQVGLVQHADRLIDVNHCHLVGSYHGGDADLRLLHKLVQMGAQVQVPTTLNASSACLAKGSPSPHSQQCAAREVVDLYAQMGCEASLTCAPYHLPYQPGHGECIAWAESNAVIYANAVLGARTNKTVQYLDLCAALTGRIPNAGLYLEQNRQADILVDCRDLPAATWTDPLSCDLLGLALGYACPIGVPLLRGCSDRPGQDNLRGLGAAAGSSGGLSLFHVEGVTPEAKDASSSLLASRFRDTIRIDSSSLSRMAAPYRGEKGQQLAAICLGTPHYSVAQLQSLALLARDLDLQASVPIYVTTSRHTLQQAWDTLELGEMKWRGITPVVDACSYYGEVIPRPRGAVLTDSAKWAYYAGGNLGVTPVLGRVIDCLASANSGCLVRESDYP